MEKYEIEILREKLNRELEGDSPDKKKILAISQDLDKLILKYTISYIKASNNRFLDKNNTHNNMEEEECFSDWYYWFLVTIDV